jgi:hypothetical protein
VIYDAGRQLQNPVDKQLNDSGGDLGTKWIQEHSDIKRNKAIYQEVKAATTLSHNSQFERLKMQLHT